MQIEKSRSSFPIDNPSSSTSESVKGVQLPIEMISEILVRLPVKSLLKSKCVSKSWLSLISTPEFIKSHFSLSSIREGQYCNHQLLFTNSYFEPVKIKGSFLNSTLYEPATHVFDVECPFLNHGHDFFSIVGIVNGLICLSIEDKELFIWNPVLRKSKRLFSPYVSSPNDGSYGVYGFGYDESKNDYKVVLGQFAYHRGSAYVNEVKIYSLLADSWRTVEDFKGRILRYDRGNYANGKIHWIACESSGLCKNWKIVTLDMVSDKLGELHQPGCIDADDLKLALLGGWLYVLCDYHLTKKMDLWMMDKPGVELPWSKVASISYVDVHAPKPDQVLCILRSGEIVLANGSCLLVYNPKRNEFRDIELDGCNSYLEAFVYVESLVWPNESCL